MDVYQVKVARLYLTLWDPVDYTGILHGLLQARILEWIAFPFSRASSQPRDQTQVSAGRFFTSWVAREAWTCIKGRVKPAGWISRRRGKDQLIKLHPCTNRRVHRNLVYDKDSVSHEGRERPSVNNKHRDRDNQWASEGKMTLVSASYHTWTTHSKLVKIQDASFKFHQSLKFCVKKKFTNTKTSERPLATCIAKDSSPGHTKISFKPRHEDCYIH